jgi:hypothetical protein
MAAEGQIGDMTEKPVVECRLCKQPMMDTEWGPMCVRALQAWQQTGDLWKRRFARHPESNPAEIEYLKKYGLPGADAEGR